MASGTTVASPATASVTPTAAEERNWDQKRLLTVLVKLLEIPQNLAKAHPSQFGFMTRRDYSFQ